MSELKRTPQLLAVGAPDSGRGFAVYLDPPDEAWLLSARVSGVDRARHAELGLDIAFVVDEHDETAALIEALAEFRLSTQALFLVVEEDGQVERVEAPALPVVKEPRRLGPTFNYHVDGAPWSTR